MLAHVPVEYPSDDLSRILHLAFRQVAHDVLGPSRRAVEDSERLGVGRVPAGRGDEYETEVGIVVVEYLSEALVSCRDE